MCGKYTSLKYRLPVSDLSVGKFQTDLGNVQSEQLTLLRALDPIGPCGVIQEKPCVDVLKSFGENYFICIQGRHVQVRAGHNRPGDSNYFQG